MPENEATMSLEEHHVQAGVQGIPLSELTARIQQAVQQVFVNQTFWVIADVTNYNFHSQKNHHYFELVEKTDGSDTIRAKASAVAWSAGHQQIRRFEEVTGQRFKSDINVLVKVSVEYHPAYGLKLILLDIDHRFTIGVLELQRQATLQRLLTECASFIKKEGDKFVTNNKRCKLPAVISYIAVVTSKSSAGLTDFTHTINANSFAYKFRVDEFYTTVQGEASAVSVYNTLLQVYNSGNKYDVVVVMRGGGAQTDFLVFDQFVVAKIVAKFPIPIITGIGHQKNETITDLLAHTSTKTPTKAAEMIIAHNRAFEDQVLALQNTIIIKSQQIFSARFQMLNNVQSTIINTTRNRLSTYKDSLVELKQVAINKTKTILTHRHTDLVNILTGILVQPKVAIGTKTQDLANIAENIKSFSRTFLKLQSGYMGHFVSVFKMMRPDNLLKKGFAIVRHKGIIISDPAKINSGDQIGIILKDSDISSVVKTKKKYDGNEFNL